MKTKLKPRELPGQKTIWENGRTPWASGRRSAWPRASDAEAPTGPISGSSLQARDRSVDAPPSGKHAASLALGCSASGPGTEAARMALGRGAACWLLGRDGRHRKQSVSSFPQQGWPDVLTQHLRPARHTQPPRTLPCPRAQLRPQKSLVRRRRRRAHLATPRASSPPRPVLLSQPLEIREVLGVTDPCPCPSSLGN